MRNSINKTFEIFTQTITDYINAKEAFDLQFEKIKDCAYQCYKIVDNLLNVNNSLDARIQQLKSERDDFKKRIEELEGILKPFASKYLDAKASVACGNDMAGSLDYLTTDYQQAYEVLNKKARK